MSSGHGTKTYLTYRWACLHAPDREPAKLRDTFLTLENQHR
jgi:hypothetical protein